MDARLSRGARGDRALDGETVQADWDLIAHAGGAMLDTGRELGRASRPLLSTLDLSPDAFGTLDCAATLAGAHRAGLADAQTLVELVGLSLENDADDLYQVAFSLKATDEAVARGLRGPR